MDNTSRMLDAYWREKKSIQKDIEEYKQKLKNEKNENLIKYYKNEIETLETEIERINRLTREIIKAGVQDKKRPKANKEEQVNVKNRDEIPEYENKVKITFDLSKGSYIYNYDKRQEQVNIFDENGDEKLNSEQKEAIFDKLVDAGLDQENARKTDPYVYKLLSETSPEILEEYENALISNSGVKNIDLEYDFRTRDGNKKREKEANMTFGQKRKMKKIAKFYGKKGIAKTLLNKTRAKLYGLLAGLGISTGLIGGGTLKYLNEGQDNQQNQSGIEINEEDLEVISDNGVIIIYGDKKSKDEQTQTNTTEQTNSVQNNVNANEETENIPKVGTKQTPKVSENKQAEAKQTPVISENKEEKDVRVSGYTTVRLGANLYDDPFDAVKIQLQKETNGKIVVKSVGEDRVYKVTKEGLYCPDGTSIEISNGDLKSAMKEKGIDVSILENIDTEELEAQGYKRMLHVVAEGIAQWVEEGDTLQVDRLGNRIEKTDYEKSQDNLQNTKQKTQNVQEVR